MMEGGNDGKVVVRSKRVEREELRNSEEETKRKKTGHSVVPFLPGICPCRSVERFKKIERLSEGAYGVVYRAMDLETGEIVALKKIKLDHRREGFPVTSLRELEILLSIRHVNIVEVKEVVVGKKLTHVFVVMEFLDHELKTMMEDMIGSCFTVGEVKLLLKQFLEGVAFLHENWILHRDLKTANLLLKDGVLKICDFGLARLYGEPVEPYTPLVCTLWYRAPELLLGTETYSPAIDMWAVGCVFAELLSLRPLFPGKKELDQIDKIFSVLGSPSDDTWEGFSDLPYVKRWKFRAHERNKLRTLFPKIAFVDKVGLSDTGFDLLESLLEYDPKKRITAQEALLHPYFTESPLPCRPEHMASRPAHYELTKDEREARKRQYHMKIATKPTGM